MAIEKQRWKAHGLDCMVRRIPYIENEYYFTGYVRVPEDNALYQKTEEELDYLSVHGGITFSSSFKNKDCDGIEGWWLGFDTNHAGDRPHGRTTPLVELPWGGYEHVWTLEEVVAETEHLAEQIAKANTVKPMYCPMSYSNLCSGHTPEECIPNCAWSIISANNDYGCAFAHAAAIYVSKETEEAFSINMRPMEDK